MSLSPDLVPTVVLLTTAAAYATGFFLGPIREGTPRQLYRKRLAGTLCFGAVPLLIDGLWLPGALSSHGLALSGAAIGGPAVAVLAVILAPILFTAAKKPMQLAAYPQIRLPVEAWDGALIARNAASWAIYLLAYEWLFRGFLLFPLVEAWGLWSGMSAMIAIYVLVHLDKPPTEAFGCFPMGLAFGLLSVETGSIFWPWLLHLGIALGSEMFCLRTMRVSATGAGPAGQPPAASAAGSSRDDRL
jgi:hypothetical protein